MLTYDTAKMKDGAEKDALKQIKTEVNGSGVVAKGSSVFTSATPLAPFVLTLNQAITSGVMDFALGAALPNTISPVFRGKATKLPFVGITVNGSLGVGSVVVNITGVAAGQIAGIVTANTLQVAPAETAELDVISIP